MYLNAQDPYWLKEKKELARKKFLELPEPAWRKVGEGVEYAEDWKYSTFKPNYLDLEDSLKTECRGEFIFTLEQALVEKPEIVQKHLFKSIEANGKLETLHASNVSKGFLVYVPKNTDAGLLEATAHGNGFCHTLIILEEGAKAKYFQEFIGKEKLSSNVVEVFLAEGASFEGVFLEESESNLYSSKTFVHGKNSFSKTLTLLTNGNNKAFHQSFLNAEGASAENYYATAGRAKAAADLTLRAVHNARFTTSVSHAKAALWEKSSTVFRGGIIIENTGAGSKASLQGNALLADDAKADEIPFLDIKNNDVQANHGASAGKIDGDELFYIQSRGLDEKEAKRLCSSAFLSPMIEKAFPEKKEEARKKIEDFLC